MSGWQKLLFGPRHVRKCAACGQPVGVAPAKVALALLGPIVVGGTLAHLLQSLPLGSAAILGGGTIAILLYAYAVPLEPRR
jgi:hypothetical protein